MKFHFIGIGGAGMSAVAKLLIEQGHEVTGSDEGCYPPISDYIRDNHIPCAIPYKKENIPLATDYIIIGKHAKLTKEENEEVAYAFTLTKPILSFPQVLKMITEGRERIVVAGSYGKSTCTSLLAWCLQKADIDAGYFIGAIPLTPDSNAHIGKAKEFILEGDEYPSLNWDKTSKFLYYHPHHLLITALAHDHINIFPTHEEYISPYFNLIEMLDKNGKLLLCLDDTTIQSVLPVLSDRKHHYITYGLTEQANWYAAAITFDHETQFYLMHKGNKVITLTTSLLGRHNIQNIVGVAALLLETKKITPENLEKGIRSFKGIIRRLDKKSEKTSIPIYEGFGSSGDKARSAIEAIKLHFPKRKLIVVFEPHTFSWRNRNALPWYDHVFEGVESVYVYKPPEHGKETHDQLTLLEIVTRVKNTGIHTIACERKENALTKIKEELTSDSIVLILSSGNMDGLMDDIIAIAETIFPR